MFNSQTYTREWIETLSKQNLIKSGNNQIDRIISKERIRDVIITNPTWNKLNKFKSGPPEAFWYWQKFVSFLK
jgi:hypothetical protein